MRVLNKLSLKQALSFLVITLVSVLIVPRLANAAPPIQLVGGALLDRTSPANIVQNGSFEDNPVGDCEGYWSSATSNTPIITIPGWNDTGGGTATYAVLTCTGTGGFGADPTWHGDKIVYFGNKYASTMTPEPTSQDPNGVWQFSSPPVITQPATRGLNGLGLEQTVATDIGTTYRLQFWASGEDAVAAVTGDGIFSLGITGYDTQYLAVPVGPARIYTFEFVATSTNTVVHFHSWGHFNATSWPSNPNPFGTSELVLDDVIINAVNTAPFLSLTTAAQTTCSPKDSMIVNSNGTDIDLDTLTYTLKTTNPGYFVIDSSTGLVTLAQANVPAGTYNLEVDVTDGINAVAQNISVTIANGDPCTTAITTQVGPASNSVKLASTGGSIYTVMVLGSMGIMTGLWIMRALNRYSKCHSLID